MEGPPGVIVIVGGTGTMGTVLEDEPPRDPKMMPTVAAPPAAAHIRQFLYHRFLFTANSSGVFMECSCEIVTLPIRVPIVATT